MTTHTSRNTLDLAPDSVGLYKPAEHSNVIKTLCPQLAGSGFQFLMSDIFIDQTNQKCFQLHFVLLNPSVTILVLQ